jgi:hypothetical protein
MHRAFPASRRRLLTSDLGEPDATLQRDHASEEITRLAGMPIMN